MNQVNQNYTGRTVDLSIFQGAQADGEQKLTLDFSPAGDVVTGIEKLVQTYVFLFLTEQGSILYQPTLGTPFITALRLGQIRTEGNVQQAFDLASELIRQTMSLASDAVSSPPDETLAGSTLLSFDLNKEEAKLTLQIQITSLAGATRQIYLPIPLAIQ